MLALESGGGGIGGDGGADKIFPFFFDGVLLSHKTHRLLLASVPVHLRFGTMYMYISAWISRFS